MASSAFQADWITGKEASKEYDGQTDKGRGSSGSWQGLGVSPSLIRALNLRGFKNPTPIQRSALSPALASPPKDVVGMARTGSGKTLAYLIPLLQRLGGVHSEARGIRGLILCPSRELAVQVLKVGKDLSRNLSRGNADLTPLRWAVVMGGESLDAQFDAISSKPDIVIATPGRFLHLAVEMDLDLRQVEMVVYDEADRLFEMGFEVQLREILHRLPSTRHSLLFSATLPTSLAEFAKAGLSNPAFIRLDTDHRISPDLDLNFLSTKPDEKDAALLTLLRDGVGIPTASHSSPEAQRAIIFASTKHHVEYLATLLRAADYRVSYIYGSLDQSARQQQMRRFRDGLADLLVVTDVAARGLDIPTMGHVINFDFPSGVRVFVHRVGRTARAGQKGHAWTLVTRDDLPYLYDLETFLERPLVSDSMVFGGIPRDSIESSSEFILNSLETTDPQLPALRAVMNRGQTMFERSRSKASREGYRSFKRNVSSAIHCSVHPAFYQESSGEGTKRDGLLAAIHDYRPQETVLEIGARGQQAGAQVMSRRHRVLAQVQAKSKMLTGKTHEEEDTVPQPAGDRHLTSKSYRDPTYFLPHENVETNRQKGYSLSEGATFAEQARSVTLDMTADDGEQHRAQKASQLKWDRKRKRFTKDTPHGDGETKMIRSESGALLPASFKSGRYALWKKQHRNQEGAAPHGSRQSAAPSGLATAETIHKQRMNKQKRMLKNARQPRKKR